MRVWMPLFLISVLMAQVGFAQEDTGAKKPPATATNPPPSTIPAGEAHFTPEQLKDYYLVYSNSDVRYLRQVFNEYLDKKPVTEDEANLLKKWDSDYYRSKFVVFSRDKNTFGGTLIRIMFQGRPDKVFVAWVYTEGAAQTLTLRAFDADKFSEEDVKRIRVRYRTFLDDKEHAM